jgi:YbbR domain-containing protein
LPVRILAPSNVELVKVIPEVVEVNIKKIVKKKFEVEVIFIPKNIMPSKVKILNINPSYVYVEGEKDKIKNINSVLILASEDYVILGRAKFSPMVISKDGKKISNVKIYPNEVMVSFSLSLYSSKKVKVKPIITGNVAQDFIVKQIKVYPNEVLIEGPTDEISKLDFVETSPVSLDQAKENISLSLPLVSPSPKIKVNQKEVKVDIIIEKKFKKEGENET